MTSITSPLISIVIPVKNGEQWLGNLLPKLMQQQLAGQTEIIIIDSGSTDRSLDIIRQFPVRLITIPPETFNHGGTRNLGVQESRGKYVVLTVQDAEPVGNDWLDRLLEGFIEESVAGVCGQQIVRHDRQLNPVQWFRPISEPRLTKYVFADPTDFNDLPPAQKREVCAFDDVNAMYRRDALLRVPFRQIGFGEDMQWAKDALLTGYALVYNNAARVYHYHHENREYTYKRTFTECYYVYRILGYVETPGDRLAALLRAAKILIREKEIGFATRIKWWFYNYRLRTAYEKAVRDFRRYLGEGNIILDRVHERICGVPPQAPEPNADRV
jgi:rhamnosyltransferase